MPMTPPSPTTPAEPLQAIAGFAALLRAHGLQVGVAEQQAFVQAALALPGPQPRRVDAAWRAIACHDARSWRQWPELFDRYWHPERLTGQVRVSGQTQVRRDIRQLVQQLHDDLAGQTPPGARRPMSPVWNQPSLSSTSAVLSSAL